MKMRRVIPLAVALLVFAVPQLPAHADTTGPFPVLPADPLSAFTEPSGVPPQTQIIDIAGNANFDRALQIDVTTDPTSAGYEGEYSIGLGAKTTTTIQAGDAALATFWARRVAPSGTGEASFVFERDGGRYTKSAVATLKLTQDWQQFRFPFRIAEDYAPGDAHFQLWLGYGKQTLQIAGVSMLDYGQGNPAGWPKVTYAGRDPNASWRSAANQRIDKYRKGNLTVHVVDPHGRAIDGAAVQVAEQKSAFNFGTGYDAAHLLDDPSTGETPNDAAHIQAIGAGFNEAVLANDLKWRRWENQTERDSLTYRALQYFRNQGRHIRGHNLVWPSWGNMPSDVQQLANDPAALRTRVDDHITDEASATNGLIDEWDVVNEPYSNHNLQDILGPDEIDSWYELVHKAAPKATLVLNDFGLVEDNGWDQRHIDYEYNLIKGMLAKHAPIGEIGLESHFGGHGGLELTPPQDLLPIVDKFAKLGIKVGVTEFDIATDDQQLQADYTRDFMTMMFSDPNVNEISNFGFWAGNTYNPLVVMYNKDWTPKPNAVVVDNLIHHVWWTNAHGSSNRAGVYSTRAFLGDYLVTVTVNGVAKQVSVHMPNNSGTSVTVVADGIPSAPRQDIGTTIGDGGFESGTHGWVPLGTPQTTSTAHSGQSALRLGNGSGVSQQPVGLQNGTSYTLSAWGTSSAAGNQCYVGVRGGPSPGRTSFQYSLTFGDDTAYTHRLLAFTPPDGTGWTHVFAWQNAGVAGDPTCSVDDVTLAPTVGDPPPAQAPPRIQPKLPGGANIAANGDLEAGSTTGWYCLGSCSLALTDSPVHGGHSALASTARAANWVGPAQGVGVVNGGSYDSSMWVRLAKPGTDTAQVELKVTTTTGSATIPFGRATVTDAGWTQVHASGVPVNWTGTLQKAEWWLSTTGGTEDLFVDDATFAPSNAPPAGQDLLTNGDVESGGTGWYCFSPCAAAATTDRAHSGTGSLAVTNRTYSWAGPAQGVQPTNGAQYKSSAWIRLAPGAAPTTAQIKVKLTMSDGTSVSIPIAAGPVSADGWSQISGNNVALHWSGTLAKAEWWISTTSGADDLYVDDAALQPAGPESTQDNPVRPTAACLVRGPTNLETAYFGYANPNGFGVPIPVSGDNTVSPAPADRGQPVQFLPGRHDRLVGIRFTAGHSVAWTLNGTTVSASASTPACN